MRILILIVFTLFCVRKGNSQNLEVNTDTIGTHSKTENIYSKFLFGDSLSSTFCILIKKEVKAHKHQSHSENVVVLSGEAMMTVADKTWKINKGDALFIPLNTVHSVKVTGKEPLKVLSIQSPRFDGTDRIMIDK